MTITGKKIITLTEEEREILRAAEDLLDELSKALGDEEHFDFTKLAETLYYIRATDKFEIDFNEE